MCEATCPLNELRRLQRDVEYIGAGDRLRMLAVEGVQRRLDWIIAQLERAGEGQSCYDLREHQ